MPQVEIIKQTKDYLVLNKPSGISVHGDGKTDQETLTDWLLENFTEVKGVGENIINSNGTEIEKPGIVHRLDKETSGVILIALNQKAYEHFKKQFKNREIKKVYHAFAYGNIKDDLFTVDASIGKDRKDFRKRTTKNPRGKVRESKTDFRVLGRGATTLKLQSTDKEEKQLFVFIEARPKTGRMHQIRVHLKHRSVPIVCDRLYSPRKEPLLGFKRMALHAKTLFFKDLEGNEIKVESDYPEDFKEAIAKSGI